MAENRKIAWRAGESTKMKGWGGQKSIQNRVKSCRKLDAKLKLTIMKKWSQNEVKIESKWEQKRIKKSLKKIKLFWMAFRGLWRGQPSPEFLQPAGRGPRGGVGEGSVCYIYII